MNACRLCGTSSLVALFDTASKDDTPVSVYRCATCGTLNPVYLAAIEDEDVLQRQVQFHEEYWKDVSEAEAEQVTEECRNLIQFYRSFLGSPDTDSLICEIGAGRGALLEALKREGYRVLGTEPSVHLVEFGRKFYHLPESELTCTTGEDFLDSLQKSGKKPHAVFLWHVLEHIARPLDLLDRIVGALEENGVLLVQVPILTKQALYPEHLMFLVQESVFWIADRYHLHAARIDFDTQNGFLGFVLRKTEALIPRPTDPELPPSEMDNRPLVLEIERLQERVQSLERILQENLASLASAEQLALERYDAIQEQSKLIEEKKLHIESTEKMAKERYDAILEQSRMISARDAEITTLSSALETVTRERDELASTLAKEQSNSEAERESLQRTLEATRHITSEALSGKYELKKKLTNRAVILPFPPVASPHELSLFESLGLHASRKLHARWSGRTAPIPIHERGLFWALHILPDRVLETKSLAQLALYIEKISSLIFHWKRRSSRLTRELLLDPIRRFREKRRLLALSKRHLCRSAPSAEGISLGGVVSFHGATLDLPKRLYFYFRSSGKALTEHHRFCIYCIPDDQSLLPPEHRELGAFPFDHWPAISWDKWPNQGYFKTWIDVANLPRGRYRVTVGIHEVLTWHKLAVGSALASRPEYVPTPESMIEVGKFEI